VAGDDLQSSLLILNPPGSLLRRFPLLRNIIFPTSHSHSSED